MRHATSNWPEGVPTDIERPLTSKGEKEALEMAKLFKEKNITLDLMMVSSALRTQSTANILKKRLEIKKSLVTQDIYETTHEHLLEVICSMPDEIDTLLLIAHNPSISMLTTLFLGIYADLPPAVLVEIHFDTKQWNKIQRENITFDSIETPSII